MGDFRLRLHDGGGVARRSLDLSGGHALAGGMSTMELGLIALAVCLACLYLGRRTWRHFGGGGGSCCGKCPVSSTPIRLSHSNSQVPLKSR